MSRNGRAPDDEYGTGSDDVGDEFKAVVEQYENRADQCTIYPVDASEFERTTTWITARDGSYFALQNCR